MYTIGRAVARLIEVRFWSPIPDDELLTFLLDCDLLLSQMAIHYVLFINLEDAREVPPDMLELFSDMMQYETRIGRMAILLGPSPTLDLQMQGIIGDSQDPNRKIFRDPREAEAFISEVLTLAERIQLHDPTAKQVIRREFLQEKKDVPTDVVYRDAGEDYALVVGVNDYPQLRSLRGAIGDAQAFSAWLVEAQGGALRAENVHTIISTVDPLGPIGPEINDALEDILQRADRSGGRRFYFYFSGHGCVGDRANDLALCLANWSSLR
ncbi:MAG TPA: caspase family protein, partial [Polyangium sp.]|nr:caspase family protein [Polyangium sp.]